MMKPYNFKEYMGSDERLVQHEDLDVFLTAFEGCPTSKTIMWSPWPSEGVKNPSSADPGEVPQTDAYCLLTFFEYDSCGEGENIVQKSLKQPSKIHFCVVPFSCGGYEQIQKVLSRLWAIENLTDTKITGMRV